MKKNYDHVLYFFLSIVILLVLFVRLHLLTIPLERDEGEYAYAGQLMLKGIPPYVGIYNMKFPGVYAMYFLIELLLGQTVTSIRLAALFINLGCIFFIFLIGKKLMSPQAGAVAAIGFSILSLSINFQGLDTNAEIFVIFFSLPAILLLITPVKKNRSFHLFLSGVLFGLSMLMKQHGIFFAVFGGVLIVYQNVFIAKGGLSSTFIPLFQLFSGILFTFLIAIGLLSHAGVLQNFWLFTFQYSIDYISQRNLRDAINDFPIKNIFLSSPLLWALGLLGVLTALFKRDKRNNSFFLLCFGLFSFLAICPGFYFRPHYFLLLIPSVSLLIAHGIHSFESLPGISETNSGRIILMLRIAPILLFILAESKYLFLLTPAEVSKAMYPKEPFNEVVKVADYLKKNSLPADKIAILGSEPEIFFYSQRESATGFIYCYPLLEVHKFRKQMESQYFAEVEHALPKYFIVSDVNQNWSRNAVAGESISAWYTKFLRDNYFLKAMVCWPNQSSPVYFWSNPPEIPHDSLLYRIEIYQRLQDQNPLSY